ncbi:hypothetical protein E5S70_37820 [Ensifer adhaerens]|uniref:DUF6998 domain-containing protein n=1 Tax=Ensifer canadensis TaxID=555315 RepID=UPI0014905284|nr:hypothetical protein [Ensifer canadensis]NOV21659.1 hypothetical protein [Ensifer canadensis]
MSIIEIPMLDELVEARNKMRAHYDELLRLGHADNVKLHFTFDGNLVGDLGEALAVKHFGIRLVNTKSHPGIDGHAPDGKTSVQVKATGTKRGPAFRKTETRADHLLFFEIDFDDRVAHVVFNGPEKYATDFLPVEFKNQRQLSPNKIREADALVQDHERLPRIE